MNRWVLSRLNRTLGGHAPAWDALRKRLFNDNPMLDSRFVDALLRHFGDGSEHLCLLQAGGVPEAMCILRPASPGIWSTFLPAQAQIGPVLLDRPDLVNSLVHALPGVCGQIDFLCNDPDFGDLSELDNRKRESRDHALTINVSLSGGFEAYWSSRSKSLVKNMRRYERRIEDDHKEIRLVRIAHLSDLDGATARYAELEAKGWKGETGTAVTTSNEQGRFYQTVSRCFAMTAGAAVYELWIGDRLAASRMTITTGRTLVILKTTYDESMSRYAPGRLLLYRVIRDGFERNAGGSIEFYTDANADQLSWATGRRWMRHVSFYRSDALSSLLSLLRAVRLALRPASPTIFASGASDAPDKIEVYKHPGEFPQDVQDLFAAAATISFDFGQLWYRNLVDTVYPQDAGARFFVLRRSGQPVAALPILIEPQWGGNQAKSLTNFYSALYAPALAPTVKASDLVPLIHAILNSHAPLSSFRMAPMDPESLVYRKVLNALRAAGTMPFHFFCFGNWYLPVDCHWEDYLAARDGALRSTIKRQGKRFTHDGGRLQIIQGGADLDNGLSAYERVYATSWKTPEPFPAFIPGLTRACAEHGWLRLGIAWLNDRPIAAQIWIVANKKANIYKLAYDEEYKAYAPGTLLTAQMMQHVIQQDAVDEVDYLIGDDQYKKTWMNKRRERWGIVAYNIRTLRGTLGLIREMASRLVRRLSAE